MKDQFVRSQWQSTLKNFVPITTSINGLQFVHVDPSGIRRRSSPILNLLTSLLPIPDSPCSNSCLNRCNMTLCNDR